MVDRRRFLQVAAGAGAALAPGQTLATTPRDLLQYLCPPGNLPDQLSWEPSPRAEPFKAELFIPPVLEPQPLDALEPPADPRAHQLWGTTLYGAWDLTPRDSHTVRQREFRWPYHPDPPYDQGTVSWGWAGPDGWSLGERLADDSAVTSMTPGPVIHARYGRSVVVRQINELPPVGASQATFALPSTTIHLHNGHTASESDGNPQDWIDSGEFWDHHYGNFPSGGDDREKLTTLWYHDHRLDFTAANVYAGLSGFYFLFDERDTGDENDPSPEAWRLPSGQYDVPLMIHDVKFLNGNNGPAGQVDFNNFYTDGWLGDQVTINRRIRPFMRVERRKYRFRLINGGPSRFYQLALSRDAAAAQNEPDPVVVVTGDGNFLPQPVVARQLFMSVAQRYDVIIDFSRCEPGERVVLWNLLEQSNGKGPSGRMLADPDGILAFDVQEGEPEDNSRVPAAFRPLPDLPENLETLPRRTWDFDYDGGLWTINGRVMDPNRIDAGIVKNSPEIWIFRNTGNDWSHPVHCHFTEFLILDVNGQPFHFPGDDEGDVLLVHSLNANGEYEYVRVRPGEDAGTPVDPIELFMGGPRRDVSTILPGDEMTVVMRFMDFEGRHVMHCHNVVHEDHAMMIRWDILPEGQTQPVAIDQPVPSREVWSDGLFGVAEPTNPLGESYSHHHVGPQPGSARDVEPTRGIGNFPPQAPGTDDDGGPR